MKKRILLFTILILLLLPSAVWAQGENLVENGDFGVLGESTLPSGWQADMWLWDEGTTYIETVAGRDGTGNAVLIENQESNDARLIQQVAVEPNTCYRLSAFIKYAGEADAQNWGANISIYNTSLYSGISEPTDEWREVELYFKTAKGQKQIDVCIRLGGYGSDCTGAGWFDDVRLEKIDAIPAGIEEQISATYEPAQSSEDSGELKLAWVTILITAAVAVVLFLFAVPALNKKFDGDRAIINTAIFAAVAGLAVRIILAVVVTGYPNDIGCWKGWGDEALRSGMSGLYTSGIFIDYPPGYMYVLYLLSAIKSVFNIGDVGHTLLVKLPAIFTDLLTSAMLFAALYKRGFKWQGLIIALLYFLNPAVIVDSAAWGQIDSILALVVAGILYFIMNDRHILAGVFVAAGVLIKPQVLMFAPLILAIYISMFLEEGFTRKNWLRLLKAVGAGLITFVIIILPCSKGQDPLWIVDILLSTLGSYDYASLSACNLYGAIGAIWAPGESTLLGVPYSIWGTIGIILSCAYVFYLVLVDRRRQQGFFYGSLLITMLFTFAGKMHERYMFPSLLLLLAAWVKAKDKRLMYMFGFFTLTQFSNIVLTLANRHLPADNMLVRLISIATVAGCIYMMWYGWKNAHGTLIEPAIDTDVAKKPAGHRMFTGSTAADINRFGIAKEMLMGRKDWLIAGILTAVYALCALLYLGDTAVPENYWYAKRSGDVVEVELTQQQDISQIWMYKGLSGNNSHLLFEYQNEQGEWEAVLDLDFSSNGEYNSEHNDLYKWFTYDGGFSTQKLRITVLKSPLRIIELAFMGSEGLPAEIASFSVVQGDAESHEVSAMFDEQQLIPDAPSQMNSTYFDEIYHARTAWEYLNGITAYENTHPPLGKVIISWGIQLFGMNPFGWRFMGTIFGILMVPAIYALAKAFFKKTKYAFIAAFLFTFDFMHFAQTRIATIDTYSVFFVILMFYFMYLYMQMNYNRMPVGKTILPLALSGLMFGLGAASKWTTIYGGIGLAVLFFYTVYKRYMEYRKIKSGENPDGMSSSEANAICRSFWKKTLSTIVICGVFFVVIPVGIYLLSYIPYMNAPGRGEYLKEVWDNQLGMFSYHANEDTPHFFQSPWYQWPILYKPIWFYQNNYLADSMMGSIASFGNPAVWWTGTAAIIALLVRAAKKRGITGEEGVLLLAFASQYLPWMLISRSTYIYHYFTSVPFVVMMIVFAIRRLEERHPKVTKWLPVYMAVVLLLFAAFYPVLTGLPISSAYGKLLRWLPTWYFTY